MKLSAWTRKIFIVIVTAICLPCLETTAQQATNSLYAQTSEMADAMIQYDADKASIMRFYSTGGSQGDFSARLQGNNYNSPERRKRLLELIDEYLEILKKSPFEKWNVNGKVDYILFKRNLESEQYQLLEEQKIYDQIAKYLPFSDRLYTLQKHFLRQFSTTMNRPIKGISPGAQQKLLSHHWPGNVRELRNVIERAVILETTTEIQSVSLPEFRLETRLRKGDLPVIPANQGIDEVMASFEREFILSSLEQNRYNLTRTADALKISRHALRYRMQRLNIDTDTDPEDDTTPAGGKETTPC